VVRDIFPAGYFGKLPIYGDFIRHGASGSEIRELDDWIQRGMEYCLRKNLKNWEEEFLQAPPLFFLFHTHEARQLLVGVLHPAQDQNGRIYPFLVYLRVDCSLFGNNLTIAPVIFSSFLAAAADLATRGVYGLTTSAELQSAITLMDFPVPAQWATEIDIQNEWLAATTMEQLFTVYFGAFADERKYTLLSKLCEIVLKLRDYQPSQWSPGLGFPLAGGHDYIGHQASFWLQLTWRMLQKPLNAPAFFWRTAGGAQPQRMWLFFRRPSGELLMPLLSPSFDSDLLMKLEQTNETEKPGIPLPYRPALLPSLTDKSATLADFLRQL